MCVLHPDCDHPLTVERACSLLSPWGYQAILTHQNMHIRLHPDCGQHLAVEHARSLPRQGGKSYQAILTHQNMRVLHPDNPDCDHLLTVEISRSLP